MNLTPTISGDINESGSILGLDPKTTEQKTFLEAAVKDPGFVSEIMQHVSGVKPNLKFYQNPQSLELLRLILEKFEGTHRLLDAKLSDGFHTEENVINEFGGVVDGITLAPASGDDVSYIDELGKRNIDSYSMGVMSFPGIISELLSSGGYHFKIGKIKQNIEAGVNGLVMGATAYITDIDAEVQKLRAKINSGSKEHLCLKTYTDSELAMGITLRNKLFSEVYKLISISGADSHILTPGFGRQGGDKDSFLAGNQSGVELIHLYNAGSDIMKGTEEMNLIEGKKTIIARLEQFNREIVNTCKK